VQAAPAEQVHLQSAHTLLAQPLAGQEGTTAFLAAAGRGKDGAMLPDCHRMWVDSGGSKSGSSSCPSSIFQT